MTFGKFYRQACESRNARRQINMIIMAVSSFDRYGQDVLGTHLNEGYNFTDQLQDTKLTVIRSKRSATKMLQFFKSEIKLIKSLCGKLERFLEDRKSQIQENVAKLDADGKADEEENTPEIAQPSR